MGALRTVEHRRRRTASAWHRWPALVSVLVTVCLAGCSDRVPLGEVAGVVRLDGQPLDSALIQFLPEPGKGPNGPQSRASSDPQGHYQLRCDDQRDGAVLGWHRVVLEDTAIYDVPRDSQTPATAVPPSRVPRAYRSANSTPLRFEVKPGRQTIDLELWSGQ